MANSKIFTIFFVVAAVVVSTFAQIIFRGPCPENVQSVDSFDVERYLGTWYEHSKYPVVFEGDGRCVMAEYTLNEESNLNVRNSLINNKTNSYEDIKGTATLVEPGKLMVKFPVSPFYTVTSNYWVLGTDYDNYAVVYSCLPKSDDTHATIIWILTREREAPENTTNEAVEVLKKNNISLDEMKITRQDSCDVNEK